MVEKLIFEKNGFTEQEVLALAQFVKRVGWKEFSQNAANINEAYLMRDAIEKLGQMLAEAGFAPR